MRPKPHSLAVGKKIMREHNVQYFGSRRTFKELTKMEGCDWSCAWVAAEASRMLHPGNRLDWQGGWNSASCWNVPAPGQRYLSERLGTALLPADQPTPIVAFLRDSQTLLGAASVAHTHTTYSVCAPALPLLCLSTDLMRMACHNCQMFYGVCGQRGSG